MMMRDNQWRIDPIPVSALVRMHIQRLPRARSDIPPLYRLLKSGRVTRAECGPESAAQAVVTVPASFTLAQREAMQVAATWAGIRVRPTAACC